MKGMGSVDEAEGEAILLAKTQHKHTKKTLGVEADTAAEAPTTDALPAETAEVIESPDSAVEMASVGEGDIETIEPARNKKRKREETVQTPSSQVLPQKEGQG